jgi:formate hydrogenlyase subunit 6/NADH:ubiquinone oxidoreductase subunit I
MMQLLKRSKSRVHDQRMDVGLSAALKSMSQKCINCDLCQKECAFLQAYGKPKKIADSFDPDCQSHQKLAFECSLCELCAAVCPVGINPALMFLAMRRQAVENGKREFSQHGTILGYEKRGTSSRYTYYGLPKGCDTVFFPGCPLPGTRPDKTWALFEHLQKSIPNLGIVLDCCSNPSGELGREGHFQAMLDDMHAYLSDHDICKVLIVCTTCYKTFKRYGSRLTVLTIYEILAQNRLPIPNQVNGIVTVHDPCSVRHEDVIHSAVRSLCRQLGLTIEEMAHHRATALCCGAGGSAGFFKTGFCRKVAHAQKGRNQRPAHHYLLRRLRPIFRRHNADQPRARSYLRTPGHTGRPHQGVSGAMDLPQPDQIKEKVQANLGCPGH